MAKDVITRFKLETTGFDSKIKEAAKELSAYSKTATQAKEGFNQFTKANVDAARALGSMATSTTNAKDRAKELVGAFNDAAKAYNSLTKEQQQSDWAKALAGSLTQLQQRIKETKAEMQGLSTDTKGGIFSGLSSKMEGALAVFGGNLMTKASEAIVQLGSEMYGMVQQGIELAKQGEGIRIAFERLGRGDILDGLREATHGTVTDLELMKAAVKFNDFKLPVEELGTMLAFAQQKAKDTGQSVDYMVDSIVTGLGRKSLMILDNLGLSAAEIKDKMKDTGDMTKAVGAIIREQMAKAGDYVETAADRAAQANVSLQNKMEELGRKAAPLEESFNHLWTSMKVGILDVIGGPLTDLLNKLTQAGRMANQYSLMGGNTKVGRMTSNLANASEDSRQSIYQLQKSQFWKYINPREQQIKDIRAWQSGERNETLQKRINVITQKYGSLDTTKIQAEVDAAKKMLSDYEQSAKSILQPVNAGINTDKAEQNVASLRRQLKELEKQRKDAVKAGDQEQVENLTKQISQVKTNLGYLDPKATKTGSSSKTVQTEIQKNQTKINALTQEYVKLGNESTEAARERQVEIQKEIARLQQLNGLLNKRAEQAQGRLLSNDDIKRKAEIDMRVNTKQIEDLRKNLTEIEGVTIGPKSFTITATDEALPRLREIEGITIDNKTMTVTAETADALRALQGIEGVTIEPKSVTITATDKALPKLREIEGITIDDKTMTVTAETADALQALQGIEGVTIDPKSVTITATDEAMPKLREIKGITIDDKTMTVTAETADALRALQGIKGVTIDPKTIEVNANTSEAQQKIDDLKAKIAELEDKNINIKAFVDNVDRPLGEQQLNNTPGTLLKAPTTTVYEDGVMKEKAVPRGGLLLDDKDMKAVRKNIDENLPKPEKKKESPLDGSKKMLNAISQLTGGIQQMGIELPSEIQGVIGVIQGAMQVIEAVNTIIGVTQTSALTANTAAMISLEAALWANTATSWIPFTNGGVVPKLANGGTIPHAADGYFIGGSHFSGDVTPIMANAGELVLNKAQQGNLASQLQGGGMQNLNLTATIKGEQIRLALNNNGRRTGRGEYVQSSNNRV